MDIEEGGLACYTFWQGAKKIVANKRMDQWNEYLEAAGTLWDEIGTDFKVGDMTRADFAALVREWTTLQTRIAEIETQLGVSLDQRQTKIGSINDFGVRFRTAVIAKFGNRHPMVARVPKLQRTSPKPTPLATPTKPS
jgi:hypothetical protein